MKRLPQEVDPINKAYLARRLCGAWLAITLSALAVCAWAAPAKKSAPAGAYPAITTLGILRDPAVTESSGVVASRRNTGLFWTHNDSGDGPFVYALGPHGENRGTYRLTGIASVTDCEDIAIGPGPKPGVPYLFLGDIGDNNSVRKSCAVYRFVEPTVSKAASRSTKAHPVSTGAVDTLRCRYPDGPHDAESLLVQPKTGRPYIVAKNKDGIDGVYAFPLPLDPTATVTLTKVGTIRISGEPPFYPNLVTGGDIAPDGKRLILRTYWSAYEYHLPPHATGFDVIWATAPTKIDLPLQPQGEGICYAYPKGDALVLTSEGKATTIYKLRKR